MIESFLRYITTERALSPLTVASYRSDLEQWDHHMRSIDADYSPTLCTTADLRDWVAQLSINGLSQRSIQRKLSALKAFYRYLMRTGDITVNPASDLTPGRSSKTLPVFVRTEELGELLDSEVDITDFTELRNRLILIMLYSTGIRSAELLGLTDDRIDLAACELKVRGKRNKDRIVPFGTELRDMIKQYQAIRPAQKGKLKLSSQSFIVKENGEPLSRRTLYNIVHRGLQGSVHASRYSPHVLRHSFASDMLNAGAELNAVSRLLGHASLASTQVYTHITYRELKQNYLTAHPRAQKKGENHGSKD